ncbi:MAG: acyl transferase, partial [Bacteroidota bacterium]
MTQRNALLAALHTFSPDQFDDLAWRVFQYQAEMNPIYARYLDLLGKTPEKIRTVQEIPGLPIRLFKDYLLQSGDWKPPQVFTSSGTTGTQVSQHAVRDLEEYLANARKGFGEFYGPIENYCTLALLPAYLERQGSSLVAMAQDFIHRSKYDQSGFFLYNHTALATILKQNEEKGIPTLLLGV